MQQFVYNRPKQIAPIKASIPREQFPRNFLVANVTRKSPTSNEEAGHVGRVTRMLLGNYALTTPVEFSLNAARRAGQSAPVEQGLAINRV